MAGRIKHKPCIIQGCEMKKVSGENPVARVPLVRIPNRVGLNVPVAVDTVPVAVDTVPVRVHGPDFMRRAVCTTAL